MKISLQLSSIGLRLAVFGVALALSLALVGIELRRFVTSVVANPGIVIDPALLQSVTAYFPNSAKVQARMAAQLIESGSGNGQSHEALANSAFQHASRAVELAPANFEYRVLLSAAAELKGDLAGAESALRESVRLASNNVNVRWQMANLFLRLGKAEESLAEFRFVTDAEPTQMPSVIGLIWRATSGDLAMIERVVGNDSSARLSVAEFLTEQGRFETAAQFFSKTDRNNRLQSPQTGRIFDAFLKANHWQWAESLWRDTMANGNEASNLLWNDSFELSPRKGLTQFDWQLNNNNFARLAIQAGGHSGNRALRLAYLGIDTTQLDREAQHFVVLQPGQSYRLECFAKPEKLVADEAPQVAILRADNRTVIGASIAVSPTINDWQMLAVDFVAPADLPAVIVTIKQTPRYRYTEPTQGVIWFDDFSLKAR
ncbi:MAG: tetratricopeptide repeat protein [Blastocatellia bacterium]